MVLLEAWCITHVFFQKAMSVYLSIYLSTGIPSQLTNLPIFLCRIDLLAVTSQQASVMLKCLFPVSKCLHVHYIYTNCRDSKAFIMCIFSFKNERTMCVCETPGPTSPSYRAKVIMWSRLMLNESASHKEFR